MLHVPGHNSEECKELKVYSDKYAAQRPHQNKEAQSGGKPKHVKSTEFGNNKKEVSIMETYDDPIPKKKNKKN